MNLFNKTSVKLKTDERMYWYQLQRESSWIQHRFKSTSNPLHFFQTFSQRLFLFNPLIPFWPDSLVIWPLCSHINKKCATDTTPTPINYRFEWLYPDSSSSSSSIEREEGLVVWFWPYLLAETGRNNATVSENGSHDKKHPPLVLLLLLLLFSPSCSSYYYGAKSFCFVVMLFLGGENFRFGV